MKTLEEVLSQPPVSAGSARFVMGPGQLVEAKIPIGTVHTWKDGKYKKHGEGDWRPVDQPGVKSPGASSSLEKGKISYLELPKEVNDAFKKVNAVAADAVHGALEGDMEKVKKGVAAYKSALNKAADAAEKAGYPSQARDYRKAADDFTVKEAYRLARSTERESERGG